MNAYEALQDKITDARNAIEDILDKEEELRIKQFKVNIDVQLEFAEAERDWNEFRKKVIDQIKDDKIPESKDIRKIGKVLKSKGENSTDAKEGLLDGSLTIDEALELVSTETKIEAIQAKVDNFVSYLTDNKEEIREYVQEPSINFAIRKIIAALSSMV